MNPQDFLQTAQKLSGSQFEADMRGAISWAYYAALHTASTRCPISANPILRHAINLPIANRCRQI